MRTDFTFDSCGAGKIHGCRWTPEGEIRGVFQIVHGIAEHVERYDGFAHYLNERGILVVAEDHMGHGKSVGSDGTRGFFDGGWEAAVNDSCTLLKQTMAEFPGKPYVLFGHSMGSFLVRSMLILHPESGISGAVICGTGWQSGPVLKSGQAVAAAVAAAIGERNPSVKLQNLMFSGYNSRVEHRRTDFDWLTRDDQVVDAYIADPMCGFVASAGLLRDMLGGMAMNQKQKNLQRMKPDLPVLLVAGGEDPVGGYGKGVRQTEQHFRDAGMRDVTCRIFPLCRHEILNEINNLEIYGFLYDWILKKIPDIQG